jgi:hypothetical protein
MTAIEADDDKSQYSRSENQAISSDITNHADKYLVFIDGGEFRQGLDLDRHGPQAKRRSPGPHRRLSMTKIDGDDDKSQ